MGADPLDHIMAYLGLGEPPNAKRGPRDVLPAAASRHVPRTLKGDTQLAVSGDLSLWLVRNEGAQWIEIHGVTPVARFAGNKARLLVSLERDIKRWALGRDPSYAIEDLTVSVVTKNGMRNLEIRYRTWKPIRLTREHARALLLFVAPIREFANPGAREHE